MVQIWFMEPYPCGDPRLPHHVFPPKKITPDELTRRTGTLYFKIDTLDQVSVSKRIAILKLERNLTREDTFTMDANSTIDFEDKIEEMFEETELDNEQARMIIEGSAYYDVEDGDGNWYRILCEYGDMIILPAGRNHRFTTTPKNFVRMRRFFKDI
uniref:1,2-dihydroxy-3-keto-5-methylthiopentene dioxygenase homolog n=1 Tax=Syphacia muris TaxID=451379 RepID=A0A0N5ADI1_9BILA